MGRRHVWMLVPAAFALGCGDGPTPPDFPTVEMVASGGDGQFGTAGQVLGQRLQVLVRGATGNLPQEGVPVLWKVEEGDATFTTSEATLTDEGGSAYATVRLGAALGEVVVRATVTSQETATATFRLFAVDRPQLQGLSTTAATAGQSLVLSGLNFSPVADQSVVLFSGIRGQVSVASTTELTVEVPPCLSSRQVNVTVQLGSVASNALPLAVSGGDEILQLSPGEIVDVADDGGLTCLRLGGGPGVSYLALVYSASTLASAQHGFRLTGLVDQSVPLASEIPTERVVGRMAPVGPRTDTEAYSSVHDQFEERLREAEALALQARTPSHGASSGEGGASSAPAAVPSQGDRRTFKVFNSDGKFDDVKAVAEYVGDEVALFVEEGGESGFTAGDLAAFADRFDDVIHPTVTGAFGDPSDLDGNDRVVILFTSTVNKLTPRGTQGFVGGFFYGIDLLPERDGSNGGEVFYTLIPDPTGQFADARPKAKLLEIVPAILAHEFQHMVHFNERILVVKAEANEALWLSEALAQMAEELVAKEYLASGDAKEADVFRSGNRGRARRYLQDPSETSLIVGSGQGTLEERGAGWLHVLYLSAQGGDGVLGQLTRSTRIGIDNITSRTGKDWPGVLADWWSATYLDGKGLGTVQEYPGIDLRSLLSGVNYSLTPEAVGGGDFVRSGSLWSSSAQYYILGPALQGSVSLRLGGEAGGVSTPGAALRWRIIRLP
mgnify:CR=1 FL=1